MRSTVIHRTIMGMTIAAILFGIGCTQTENEGTKKTAAAAAKTAPSKKQAKASATSATTASSKKKTTALGERHRYEAFAGVRMREYANRVAAHESGASRATGRYKGRLESEARTLETKYADVQEAYRRLTTVPDASWESAKKNMDMAMQRFDAYYGRIASE